MQNQGSKDGSTVVQTIISVMKAHNVHTVAPSSLS
jgi:hypothetical protein